MILLASNIDGGARASGLAELVTYWRGTKLTGPSTASGELGRRLLGPFNWREPIQHSQRHQTDSNRARLGPILCSCFFGLPVQPAMILTERARGVPADRAPIAPRNVHRHPQNFPIAPPK